MNNETIIRAKKSFTIFPAMGSTVLAIILGLSLKEKLLAGAPFNANGFDKIIFLVFLLISVVVWVLHFANIALYKITNEGISFRRNFFTIKINCFAPWESIDYFFLQGITGKTYYEELIVKIKERDKFLKIGLTGLSISKEELLKIFVSKSIEYKFEDLGFETNRYSKY